MFAAVALRFVNHLLDGEAWARARLQPFSGQTARLACGPLRLDLTLTASGTFALAGQTATPTVTLTLPTEALWPLAADRAAIVGRARINGAADLAECLGFVLRHLRWEIEDDLAPLVGDIAARRLVRGAQSLAAWQRTQARNLAITVADYLSIENPLIVRRGDFAPFVREVARLGDDTERLARRIQGLAPNLPTDALRP